MRSWCLKRVLFAFALFILTLALSASEEGDDEWVHTWAGEGFEQGYALAVGQDREIYVTGYTKSFGAGSSDLLFLKYDADGNLLWQKTWGGAKEDYGKAIAIGEDEGIYITGYTRSFGDGDCDVILLKYDASGSLLWEKAWGGSDWDEGNDLLIDQAGNIYITGNTRSFKGGENPLILLKYDPNGNLLWRKAWMLGYYAEGSALAFDGEGNLLVTGSVHRFGDSFTDVVLLKYDADGNLLWQRQWGGDRHDRGSDLIQDTQGSVYVAGHTSSFGAGEVDALLLKFDTQGSLLWARTWGGHSDEHGMELALDDNGDVLVTGSSVSIDELGSGWVFLLRYDAKGNLLQQRAWGGKASGSALVLDGHGAAYICGHAFNRDGSWQDVVGEESSPAGRMFSTKGTESIPEGLETTPNGTESEPEGLLDEKGGGLDVLVMKLSLADTLAGAGD